MVGHISIPVQEEDIPLDETDAFSTAASATTSYGLFNNPTDHHFERRDHQRKVVKAMWTGRIRLLAGLMIVVTAIAGSAAYIVAEYNTEEIITPPKESLTSQLEEDVVVLPSAAARSQTHTSTPSSTSMSHPPIQVSTMDNVPRSISSPSVNPPPQSLPIQSEQQGAPERTENSNSQSSPPQGVDFDRRENPYNPNAQCKNNVKKSPRKMNQLDEDKREMFNPIYSNPIGLLEYMLECPTDSYLKCTTGERSFGFQAVMYVRSHKGGDPFIGYGHNKATAKRYAAKLAVYELYGQGSALPFSLEEQEEQNRYRNATSCHHVG